MIKVERFISLKKTNLPESTISSKKSSYSWAFNKQFHISWNGFRHFLTMEFQNLKTERDKTLKIKNQVSFCKDKAELAEMPLCLFEILHLYDTAY